MPRIHAIYENGVFRPLEDVHLPERSEVEFEPRVVERGPDEEEAMDRIYEIMSRSYDTGDPTAAARHSEHQP